MTIFQETEGGRTNFIQNCGGGVRLRAFRGWGGGRGSNIRAGRWHLGGVDISFRGGRVGTKWWHPPSFMNNKYCVSSEVVWFGFPGISCYAGHHPVKRIICSPTQAFCGLNRLRQSCCTLLNRGLINNVLTKSRLDSITLSIQFQLYWNWVEIVFNLQHKNRSTPATTTETGVAVNCKQATSFWRNCQTTQPKGRYSSLKVVLKLKAFFSMKAYLCSLYKSIALGFIYTGQNLQVQAVYQACMSYSELWPPDSAKYNSPATTLSNNVSGSAVPCMITVSVTWSNSLP